jgi:hypothetical protein
MMSLSPQPRVSSRISNHVAPLFNPLEPTPPPMMQKSFSSHTEKGQNFNMSGMSHNSSSQGMTILFLFLKFNFLLKIKEILSASIELERNDLSDDEEFIYTYSKLHFNLI